MIGPSLHSTIVGAGAVVAGAFVFVVACDPPPRVFPPEDEMPVLAPDDPVASVEAVEPERAPATTAPATTTTRATKSDPTAIGTANDAPVFVAAAATTAADAGPVVATETTWLAPVYGKLTQSFGTQDDGTFHDAIDVRASVGTEIAAPTELHIVYIGYRSNAGRFIIADAARDNGGFDGDGYQLTFAHMSHVEVVEGQRVQRGELLGNTGVSGSVTGPHLHFRVENVVGGSHTPVDPLTFFQLPFDSPY